MSFPFLLMQTMAIMVVLLLHDTARAENTPNVIRYLVQYPGDIPVINGWFKGLVPDELLPPALKQEEQYLVKNADGLFCGINGTGRLYRVKDVDGTLAFERIDSTFFSGHNFFAANFVYKGELYSFGGYGFWHQNGMLRKFNAYTHDWQPVFIAEERPVMFNLSFFWFDAATGDLYMNPAQRVEAFRHKEDFRPSDSSRLCVLNIGTGEWRDLGFFEKRPSMECQLPFGVFNFGAYEAVLFDFKFNRLYKGKPSLNGKLIRLRPAAENNLYFTDGAKLFFANIKSNIFDSLKLSPDDFEYTGKKIYQGSNAIEGSILDEGSIYRWALYLLLLVGMSFGIIRLMKKPKQRIPGGSDAGDPKPGTVPAKRDDDPPFAVFTPLEKELLCLILENISKEEPVRVDEVNKLLGLSGKNESVQKKNRNDIINQINQKWSILNAAGDILVVRLRSDLDRRIFYYTISPAAIPDIRKWLA